MVMSVPVSQYCLFNTYFHSDSSCLHFGSSGECFVWRTKFCLLVRSGRCVEQKDRPKKDAPGVFSISLCIYLFTRFLAMKNILLLYLKKNVFGLVWRVYGFLKIWLQRGYNKLKQLRKTLAAVLDLMHMTEAQSGDIKHVMLNLHK